MIDPILSLAISMHSNPGVYALLLGSGVSRSAGIPTGWDIVLDLIRKVAKLAREDCEPNPDEWYRKRYGEEPDYTKLLDQVAKSQAERQQLLRSYFEPTEEEREQGLKLPTKAHRAVAELVASGHVRLILTTNFDRLTEKALEDVGITPTVISSPDHVRGAIPLTHSKCTVVKIHGDYLDTRIKNTPEELASYDAAIDSLLDRAFDEYGLIVCGWSSVWDNALRVAVERSPNHRFTTYWAYRGRLEDAAKLLVDRRRATPVEIKDADSFFQELAEKVASLQQLERPHPLSAPLVVATLKRYLPEDRYLIRAHDLVMDETNRLRAELNETRFPIGGESATYSGVADRMREYAALTETLQMLVTTGCYWGRQQHESFWAKCVEMTADHSRPGGGLRAYVNLRDFPALLLMYAGGIASIAANKYGNLAAVLTRPSGIDVSWNRETPLAHLLNPDVVIASDVAQHIVAPGQRSYTPVSDYLFQVLREPLKELLPRDAQYVECFDRFEYLWTLIHVDLREQLKSHSRWVIGRYLWRDTQHFDASKTVLTKLYEEMDAADDWQGLQAGLFGGSKIRLQAAREIFNDALPRLRQSVGMWV
jgi:hypothetical protein